MFVDGLEKPVAFASQIQSSAEKDYAQIKCEALALIFGICGFHKFLMGRIYSCDRS